HALLGDLRCPAAGLPGRGAATRREGKDCDRAGVDVRLGAVRREHRPGHRHEDVRCLRALEGAPGKVRVRARPDRGHGQGAGGPSMSAPRFAIAALVFASTGRAWAQTSEDLQQQLQALKKQYEETAQELQRRIAALEQQIQQSQQAATASAERAGREAAEKTLERSLVNVGQQYQGQLPSSPTYDLL